MKVKESLFAYIILIFFITACSFSYDTVYQNDDDPNLVLDNVEYVRITNGNPEILVKAEEIRHFEAKQTMELEQFSFEQYNAAPEGQKAIPDINARGKADIARMETDTNNVFIQGDISIEVVSEDISIETTELSWQDKERSISAPGQVNIRRSDGTTLKGTGFSADVRSRSWEFESAVEGSVVEKDEENDDLSR